VSLNRTSWKRSRASIRLSKERIARLLDGALIVFVAAAFVVDLTIASTSTSTLPGRVVLLAAIAILGVRHTLLRGVPSLAFRLRARGTATPVDFEFPTLRASLWALLLFAAATGIVLHQQVAAYTSVPDRGDPLFSMWRIAWVAHQLPRDPLHLFDANIFHPAARTLAYSDAMLVPALIGAPALWLGAPVAIVYTSLLLVSYVAAAFSMFLLGYATTRHSGAAAVAGLVFAFDTFRLLHYSHLELQFTMFMPLALLFMLRTLASGRRKDGALAGLCVALQALCSLYYGMYLALALMVFALCWALFVKRIDVRTVASLTIGIALAAIVCVPFTIPYWANRGTVGERNEDEIRAFSATGRDYFTAYRQSSLYGLRLWSANDTERKLFPGVVPLALGAAAFLPPAGVLAVPAVATLAVSVDASLGLHGVMYATLYRAVPMLKAFRVPARFRGVATLFLALLSALALANITRRWSVRWSRTALSLVAVLLLIDVHPALDLQPIWNHAPGIYKRIPDPHAVVADLPLPAADDPFWHDPVYMYFSTFHWHPLVNGSSGFAPPWYAELGVISRHFPDDDALDAYRRLGAEYFVLHEGYYRRVYKGIVSAADAQPRLQFVAAETWEEGECRLYRLLR
jgi:hypothetical protein